MATFATRSKRDTISQTVHDRVIEELAAYWHNPTKYNISTNPGSDKERWVGSDTNYPDLVGWVRDGNQERAVWIAEVETASSITTSEAQNQWAKYAATGVSFFLVVPTGHGLTAKAVAGTLNLSIERFYEFSFANGRFSLKQV